MIFDAGAFIALENPAQRRVVLAIVSRLRADQSPPVTTELVLAEAWRDPARQGHMARLVKATNVYPFSDPKVVGSLCGRSGTSDVVDADLATWAEVLGETILTTDSKDMAALGARHVEL